MNSTVSDVEANRGSQADATEPAGSWRDWIRLWRDGWDRFWFTPRDPATLGLIRILTGLIVFYSHLVWTSGLNSFLGTEGMLPAGYREAVYGQPAWSHLDLFSSPATLWGVHLAGLVIVAIFTLGLWTRVTSVLVAMLVISYANRRNRSFVWAGSDPGFSLSVPGDWQLRRSVFDRSLAA